MIDALALQLIVLHQPDGRPVYVNPAEITYFAAPRREGSKVLLGPGSHCVIFLAGRHYFAVAETCDAVRQLIGGQ